MIFVDLMTEGVVTWGDLTTTATLADVTRWVDILEAQARWSEKLAKEAQRNNGR